jgi:hypothetical protein
MNERRRTEGRMEQKCFSTLRNVHLKLFLRRTFHKHGWTEDRTVPTVWGVKFKRARDSCYSSQLGYGHIWRACFDRVSALFIMSSFLQCSNDLNLALSSTFVFMNHFFLFRERLIWKWRIYRSSYECQVTYRVFKISVNPLPFRAR